MVSYANTEKINKNCLKQSYGKYYELIKSICDVKGTFFERVS